MNANDEEELSVHYLTQASDLAALRPEWELLWRRSPLSTPFNAPAWLIPWWHTFGNGCLRVCVIRRGRQLAAVLPAYLLEGRLQLVGIGMSDYLDLLAERTLEEKTAELALCAVSTMQKEWREVEFQNLAPESPLLNGGKRMSWNDERSIQSACPVIALPPYNSGLASIVPRRQYQNYRSSQKRVEREGLFSLESGTPEDFEQACEALFRLHREQWSARGLPGVVTAETSAFLREGIEGLHTMGITRWYLMRYGREIVGVHLGFSLRKRLYYYLGGLNPSFQKHSIGTLLVGGALQNAMEEGHTLFDFLRGGESYKYGWGASDQPLWNRTLKAV